MANTPEPGTPEWDALLRGVLFGNTADRKGWIAQLAEAGDDPRQRAKVIKEIQKNGKL